MDNLYNAYINQEIKWAPLQPGKLDNRTFAVKDVFHLKGYTCTAGNPDWLRTHGPADQTAPAVLALLKEGAALNGTLQTDELMYSLNGENAHYGTPVNPKAPDRLPGGSSSGSAVAAAAGLVDFALGTDTGGSVRIPSSYCGLFGIRPTHGAVAIDGVIPLAKSFDTVGWMARDIELLAEVGDVLLPEQPGDQAFERVLIGTDAWALPDAETKRALEQLLPAFGPAEAVEIAKEGLAAWTAVFRTVQAMEIWEEHGEWITAENPVFGPGIAERFQMASTIKRENAGEQLAAWANIRSRMNDLLKNNAVLVIPTAPGPAPLLNLQGEEAEAYRAKAMQLTCIAGLAGLPQVTLPLAEAGGFPAGLSIIGGRGQDKKVLRFAAQITKAIQQEAAQ